MRLAAFRKYAVQALAPLYDGREAGSIVDMLLSERLGLASYTYVTEPEMEIPTAKLDEDIHRLFAGEPVQYVLGFAEFYSRRFKVSPAVLIPRPETEELVEAVVRARGSESGLRVLDLCTGSGCIAWTLAFELSDAEVTAVDISTEALDIARSQFEGKVDFVQADVLAEALPLDGTFDVIVSNPPYILNEEKLDMRRNVLDYEPDIALFAPDSDPLAFYRAIARHAERLLAPGGLAVLEINPLLAEQTAALYDGFSSVNILQDISRRPRFVTFRG